MKFRLLGLGVAVVAMSSHSFAGSPQFLDSRAFAMGGVGVASARPAAAGFYNPALLAIKQRTKSDGFGLLLPSVGALVQDEDELRDEIDDFEEDVLTPFENTLDSLENANFSSVAEAQAAADDLIVKTQALQNELNEFNNDQALVDLGAGVSFMVPDRKVAFGFFASGAAQLSLTLEYRDDALLDDYISDLETARDANDINAVENLDLSYANGDLQSDVRAVGVGVGQLGVSLATSFELSGRDIAIGVSPKLVELKAYDFVADVDDFESDDLEDSEVSDSGINFDLGAATYLDEDDKWLLGFSIQNVLSQEVKTEDSFIAANNVAGGQTIDGVTIELKPTMTTGISYSGSSYILSADLQLNKTDEVKSADGQTLIPARQMIGIGAEYDLFETMQFRLGAMDNLEGDGDPLLTTGLGFTVLGASLELAAMGNSNSLGASFQIGSTF